MQEKDMKDVQEGAFVERVGYGGGLFRRGPLVTSGDGVQMCDTEGRYTGQIWPIDAPVRLAKTTIPASRNAYYRTAPPHDETVDHPAHYGGAENPHEPIKIIEHYGLGFCTGNAIKYILRAGKKPGAQEREDLRKAAWYLAREIARLEKT